MEYPVIITDEEDRPVLSLSAAPASITEEDDDTTTNVAENVSVLTVAAASPKTFATEQTITLTFGGTAVYGTHYSVSPADTDANAMGHQVLLPAETASVQVTVTAAGNDTADGNRLIEVAGSLDGMEFDRTSVAVADNETTTNTAATGKPGISGTAAVGQTLTATTSGISDADGKTKAEDGDTGYAYTYQWILVDGNTETDISGETSSTYTPSSSDVGKTIRVRVSFTDDAGNAESPLPSDKTAAVVAVVPGAPTGLAATGAGRSIELAWEPPADDGGGAVTGYRIESSADGSDPWTEVEADTGSDATDYRHRGLAPEETRHYRVYAINAAGTGTAASNVASATTLVDGRGALLIPSPLVVDEGTARSYTVELTEAPTGTVRVTVAGASGTDVTLSRNRLTFTTTNWGIPQTVTVTAREDGDAVDDTVTLTHTVSRGGGYDDVVLPDLEVTVADNDGGIVASPAALTVAEGGTGSYGLTLTRRPTSDVTVTVMEAAGVTADQATLTFTADNWDTAQPVTVTGSQDGNKNDETVTVRHAATGGGYAVAAGDALSARVTVTVHDDEATAPARRCSIWRWRATNRRRFAGRRRTMTAAPRSPVTSTGSAPPGRAMTSTAAMRGPSRWAGSRTASSTRSRCGR